MLPRYELTADAYRGKVRSVGQLSDDCFDLVTRELEMVSYNKEFEL